MNPEFQRNLWLEAGPRRLAWTAVVLAAVYGAVLVLAGERAVTMLGGAGGFVFVLAAMIWGSRTAGGAVAEEVRQRTWDFQRLSALTPWEMTWGKLFGATSLAWVAGLSGLALAFLYALSNRRPDQGLQWVAGGVAAALLLQAGAMAMALITVRRARAEGRMPAFRFTFGGFIGLLVVLSAAQRVFPTRGLNGALGRMGGGVDFQWWGMSLPVDWFVVCSLAVFAGWALVAAWRLMRLELQMQNGPWVWPAFVVFAAAWAAGMASGGWTLRFAVAGGVFAACAYVAVFAEPADRVRTRQFGRALKAGNLQAILATVPAVVAPVKLAALAVIGMAVSRLLGEGSDPAPMLALAALAFLLRDLAIVAYFRFGPRSGRGDFGAVLGLFLAYFVGGVLGNSMGAMALFAPSPASPTVSVFAGAVQAAVLWFLAWRRIRAPQAGV